MGFKLKLDISVDEIVLASLDKWFNAESELKALQVMQFKINQTKENNKNVPNLKIKAELFEAATNRLISSYAD